MAESKVEGAGEDAEPILQQRQPGSQRITPFLKAKPKVEAPPSAGKFGGRAQPGTQQAVLNPHIEPPGAASSSATMEVDAGSSGRQLFEISVLGSPLPRDACYMLDRIENKVAYCERRILDMTEEVESSIAAAAAAGQVVSGGGTEEEDASAAVHPVGVAAQEPTVFAGRIVCDSEGRLNAQSLLLEGSQRDSEGVRVKLDVSKCPGCRLFPGQVVLIKGTNPSGHCVVASEVLPGIPLPMARTSLSDLAQHAAARGERGLSVVVAAGPYTVSEDLAYEPLAALLEYCGQHQPNVVLLAGPFVDVEHPQIKDGMLDELFGDVYRTRVRLGGGRWGPLPACLLQEVKGPFPAARWGSPGLGWPGCTGLSCSKKNGCSGTPPFPCCACRWWISWSSSPGARQASGREWCCCPRCAMCTTTPSSLNRPWMRWWAALPSWPWPTPAPCL